MKLTLSLVLLINLQLINAFGYLSPFLMHTSPYNEQVAAAGQFIEPQTVEYNSQGVDELGNPFFAKKIVQTNYFPSNILEAILPLQQQQVHPEYYDIKQQVQPEYYDIQQQVQPEIIPAPYIEQQELPRESVDSDYFELPTEDQQLGAGLVGNIFDNFFTASNLATKDLSPKKSDDLSNELFKLSAGELTQPQTSLNLQQFAINPQPSYNRRLDFLQPESAQTYNLPGLHGLGQYHLKPVHTEEQQYVPFKIDTMKPVHVPEQKLTMSVKAPAKTLESSIEDDEELVNFQRNLDQKERGFLKRIKQNDQRVEALNARRHQDTSNHMYIQTDRKFTTDQADALLVYISELAGFPYKWIRDTKYDGRLITFTADHLDVNVLCSIIKDNHLRIEAKNGLKIDCGLVSDLKLNSLKHEIKNTNSRKLFIVTIIVSVSVLCAIIVLLTIFIIRRKAYLRQELIDKVTFSNKKKSFDDVENLVETDAAKKSSIMNRVWPFKTKKINIQQTDLCRSSKLNITSPLNNTTQTTDLSSRCDNIESTPITVDERKKSNNTSTSS